MHELRTIPTANMTYTRSQNYTNIMVNEHGIQTFEVVLVLLLLSWLLLDVFVVITTHTSLIIFEQVVGPNILKYWLKDNTFLCVFIILSFQIVIQIWKWECAEVLCSSDTDLIRVLAWPRCHLPWPQGISSTPTTTMCTSGCEKIVISNLVPHTIWCWNFGIFFDAWLQQNRTCEFYLETWRWLVMS
jgi:hypothetical protein